MCGRYMITSTFEAMGHLFEADLAELGPDVPRRNVSPTEPVPVVVSHDGDRTVVPMRWGLLPPFYRGANGGPLLINARAEGIERIFIGYAECGTQGQLDKICEEEGVERIAGPHCYAFFSGTEKFLAECEDEFTAFYLTDLITRQFEAFVIEPLKLDKHPELRDMVFGNYTKIVYLAQTEDPALQEKAKWAADYLKLDYEYRYTGYGDLIPALRHAAA